MSSLKQLFSHYSQFLSVNVINLLLSFITFPILARFLSREQYGILGLVTTTMVLATAVGKAGLSDGVIRMYAEYDHSAESRNLFSSTVMVRGLVFSLISLVLYLCALPLMSWSLNLKSSDVLCFLIMAAYLIFRPFNALIYNMLRVNHRTLFMNVADLSGKVIAIGLSLILLIYVTHDLYGYFIGIAAAEIMVATVLFIWFMSNYKISLFNVSGELARKLIKFGLPLLFLELCYSLLSYASRYIIGGYLGADALGVYSVGYNLAMYIANMISFPLSYAIIPIYVKLYEKEGREKTEEFLRRSLHYLLIVVIPLCIGYYAISHDLIVLLASQKYESAASFSFIIVVANLLLGINNIINAGLYLAKKSMTILAILMSCVCFNLIANIIAVPAYGIMGSAVAMLITCVLGTIATAYFSYKFLVVRISIRGIGYYICLSIIMLIILNQIHISVLLLSVSVKCLVGTLIIAIGTLFREKEIRAKLKLG